jgi:leader peptidase (prepilin peptidase) / N-methyltransferase
MGVAVRLAAGRCPGCGARLRPAPWSVEAAAAVVLGLLAAMVHPRLVLAAVCLLACAIPLAFIDLAIRRLPDVLTGPAPAGRVNIRPAPAGRGRAATVVPGQWIAKIYGEGEAGPRTRPPGPT